MTTGRDIREARQRAGLTQGQLAERIGVSMRTVGNWERGETPPTRYAARIEQVLDGLVQSADAPSIGDYSDAALLAEIARRFDLTRSTRDRTPDRPHPVDPDEPLADRPVRDGTTTPRRRLSAVPGTLSHAEREELYRDVDKIDLDAEPYAAARPEDTSDDGEPL